MKHSQKEAIDFLRMYELTAEAIANLLNLPVKQVLSYIQEQEKMNVSRD